MFGFDSGRKRIVFRQFHIEGFVSQYVQDPASTPERLVFTTEAIENIPAGWRARETYIFSGPDRLEEIFELAEQGKDFELSLAKSTHEGSIERSMRVVVHLLARSADVELKR